MKKLDKTNLYIVADGHHFVMLAKDVKNPTDHLKAFKKVIFEPEKFEVGKRADPGKILDRVGGARSAYEFPNLSIKSDINYLKEACKVIDAEFKNGNFSHITLVGDSEILMLMKKSMSKKMLAKVFREVYKNYTKTPIDVLEKLLMSDESA